MTGRKFVGFCLLGIPAFGLLLGLVLTMGFWATLGIVTLALVVTWMVVKGIDLTL